MSHPLSAMLEARSVAVVGASTREGSFGSRLTTEITRSRPDIEVHLVNPRYETIGGRSCVASLDEIDHPVDLVLLGVPDAALEAEVGRAARRGDRSAVVYANAHGGLAPDGSSLRGRIARIARGAGMQLCGGGCMGFVNVGYGLRAIGYLEPDPLPEGPVAWVTHSGSAFSALLRAKRGFGFSLAVSAGQELVTSAAAYVEYALGLEQTRVVALLLEALREPAALVAALARAARAEIPVVALTVGGSPTGREMVAAHSGALAGDDGAWEALFDAYGVIRVHDLDEMADTLELFTAGRRAAPTGPRGGIATVHDSGAERALVVDVAHGLGLSFAEVSEATLTRIAALLDPGLEPGNPLDVWGTGSSTRESFGESLVALAADDEVAAVALCVDLVPELDGDDEYLLAAIDAHDATHKPVVALSNLHSAIDPRSALCLREAGVPVLEGTKTGLAALSHLLWWRDRAGTTRPESGTRLDPARKARWTERLSGGVPVGGAEGFEILEGYGISTTPARSVEGLPEALAAADAIGYPVVLKTDESGVAHKSDVGGVVLGIAGPSALERAYTDLALRLGKRTLVAATAPDGVDLALGLVFDPALGPLVLVAAGGVLIEVLDDRAVGLPPLDEPAARRLVEGLRVRRLLDGVRGSPPADLGALTAAIVSLSNLAEELGEVLDALDVNPLRCSSTGAVALDVLVEARR